MREEVRELPIQKMEMDGKGMAGGHAGFLTFAGENCAIAG